MRADLVLYKAYTGGRGRDNKESIRFYHVHATNNLLPPCFDSSKYFSREPAEKLISPDAVISAKYRRHMPTQIDWLCILAPKTHPTTDPHHLLVLYNEPQQMQSSPNHIVGIQATVI